MLSEADRDINGSTNLENGGGKMKNILAGIGCLVAIVGLIAGLLIEVVGIGGFVCSKILPTASEVNWTLLIILGVVALVAAFILAVASFIAAPIHL